jgi:Domain of unknown function (DUF4394)
MADHSESGERAPLNALVKGSGRASHHYRNLLHHHNPIVSSRRSQVWGEIGMRETTYTKTHFIVFTCLALLLVGGAWHVAITGTDTALVGIDFRVQDGKLYGVGNGGGVYTIDPTTAEATFVNALTVALVGTTFGVDFNPAADRLRIISDAGQNLAHNVNDGGVTATNAALTYTAPPAMQVAALGVIAAAYTNNDLNQPSTGTTLFDLDTTLDQVAIQSPPGNGILVATGKLGVDAVAASGFDIYSLLEDGVTVANFPFATLAVNGKYRFYSVNVTTGQAISLGRFDEAVVDIAIPLGQ